MILFSLFGWFEFHNEPNYIPPLWLVLLWLGFATNVTTLSPLVNKSWLIMAVLGSILAPLSYLAAAKLGAVSLPFGFLTTWLLLAPIWFVLLPALFFSQYKLEDAAYEG